MKVLITGHKGFIGRHLLQECVARGFTVTGVDIFELVEGEYWGSGFDIELDCRTFFAESIAGMDRRSVLTTDLDFDLVFHCAATVGGRATIDGDPLAVATNLSLDAEMFNWTMRTKPGRVVYFSSSAAYPVDLQNDWATTRDLREPDIRGGAANIGRPDQTYGWSKLTGEMLAEHVNAAGIPVHVFRPFSGYGSDQSANYPFGAFIDRALRREDPFEVWGDGNQVRDFIHVDDIVGAVFAAIEQDVRGPVNLCTGRGMSFNELAALVIQATGKDYRPAVKYISTAPSGVQYRVGDPSRMLAFYTPTVSVERGIRRALDERVAVCA